MSAEEKQLSWNPIRRGDIYCAPACGGKCKWTAYQKACKDAKALAKKMGKGWEPHVSENLGWHWRVQTTDGTMQLYHDGEDYYTAFFARKSVPVSMSRGNWVGHGETPEKAIEAVREIVAAEITTIQEALDSYDDTVGD